MDWPLLGSLGEDERRAVLDTTRVRRFASGEVLVHEGDPADTLHLVESGRLAVRVTTPEGDNATLNVLGPGDYFGELSLLDGRTPVRTATIVALERVQTRTLSAAAFRELRLRHRAAEELLLALLARRVEELSARLLEALYDGLDRRVYRRLSELTDAYAEGRQGSVVVPLRQELLAELSGGTRPSVNQILQRLVGLGIVELGRGRITVHDRAALRRRAD